jgi:hypothetical protein
VTTKCARDSLRRALMTARVLEVPTMADKGKPTPDKSAGKGGGGGKDAKPMGKDNKGGGKK